MQLICDGVKGKGEVLDTTIEEYKEVYIKAKREFDTVVNVSCRRERPVSLLIAVRYQLHAR